MDNTLSSRLDSYIEENLGQIKKDIKTLIDIKSVSDTPAPGAPYGTGVKKALDAALALAAREGFDSYNLDGHVGYSHYGNTEKYIAMMAHTDVVPEGEGWDTDPFCCVEKDGYLLGRGVWDNKGAYVMSLYAMRFLIENNVPLKYGFRLIAGCDEETGMTDIEYYLSKCGAPTATIIPDASFPVCHGEKGIYAADLVSDKKLSADIIELKAGLASNVVPERARAVINAPLEKVKAAANGDFAVSNNNGAVEITAFGIAGHAGHPDGSRNAIIMLLKLLCENGLVGESDREILSFVAYNLDVNDGTKLGIQSDDGIFTPLTCVGGMIRKTADGFVCQNVNCRYPTSTSGGEITEKLEKRCAECGYSVHNIEDSHPHYIPADSAFISCLMNSYREASGRSDEVYVMSGGTYARHIPNAVAFGAEFDDEVMPAFVGTIHGKNEGISIETLKLAIRIYAHALCDLQQIEL